MNVFTTGFNISITNLIKNEIFVYEKSTVFASNVSLSHVRDLKSSVFRGSDNSRQRYADADGSVTSIRKIDLYMH